MFCHFWLFFEIRPKVWPRLGAGGSESNENHRRATAMVWRLAKTRKQGQKIREKRKIRKKRKNAKNCRNAQKGQKPANHAGPNANPEAD
jgi:hypothetical protein